MFLFSIFITSEIIETDKRRFVIVLVNTFEMIQIYSTSLRDATIGINDGRLFTDTYAGIFNLCTSLLYFNFNRLNKNTYARLSL